VAILAIIRGIIVILTMALYLVVYGLSRIFMPHTKESAFNLRRHWIKYIVFPVLNIKVELKGKPPVAGALYLCNHRSFLDPAIISKYLDAFIIAKAEIADYPLINKGAEVTGIIWVRRDNRDSRQATKQAYVDTINDGYNVLVYPEGTVSKTPEALPFKRGTLNEAAKNGFKVVPVALEYRDKSDIWTIDNLLKFYIQQASKWKIQTKLSFGPVLESDDARELHDQAFNWIQDEIKIQQEGWSRAFPKES